MLTKTTEFYITYAMGGHSIIQVNYFFNLCIGTDLLKIILFRTCQIQKTI